MTTAMEAAKHDGMSNERVRNMQAVAIISMQNTGGRFCLHYATSCLLFQSKSESESSGIVGWHYISCFYPPKQLLGTERENNCLLLQND